MRLIRYGLIVCCCTSILSCEEEKDVLVISDEIPNINSVIVKEDSKILIDGFIGQNRYFALMDNNLNVIHKNVTNFQYGDEVYYPYPAFEIVMKTGDYGSPKGTYISYDDGKSFQESYTFEPTWGDWWLGYIPIDENSYILHAGSNWEDSKIVTIENGNRISNFKKVLKGYNITSGFFDNDTLHIIANEVTHAQPSVSMDIYYFYSTDKGQTWAGKHYFGPFGAYNNTFKKIDDNTIFLYKPHLQMNYISHDNGNSWQKNEFSVELSDITYLNKSHCLGIFKDKFYESNDGGTSWRVKTNLDHKADYLYFANASIGVIYSDSLIGYTNNGGLDWKYIINR